MAIVFEEKEYTNMDLWHFEPVASIYKRPTVYSWKVSYSSYHVAMSRWTDVVKEEAVRFAKFTAR